MFYKAYYLDIDEGDVENGPPLNGIIVEENTLAVCRANSENEARLILQLFLIAEDIPIGHKFDIKEATEEEYFDYLNIL